MSSGWLNPLNTLTCESECGRDPMNDDFGRRFAYVLKQTHKKTGFRAVVLDEE